MAITTKETSCPGCGELEATVAALARATLAAVNMFGAGNFSGSAGGGPWEQWARTGAEHADLTRLHEHLQAHPAPHQD